ncbi:MAG: long-chain fatty acid--CoA ligase [Syntrophales bacterium]|jgi:long-chain acyl-CoA synthetase|nr:long-chain fatty acid--CoA ligase [Syntrophales bacterium]MDY0045163.1 long-chain fatty acid--CoA ligase [Syntrophales bacterium]
MSTNKTYLEHYDYCVPAELRTPRLSVPELLQVPANAHPDKAATNFYGTEITFWELRNFSLRMANALANMGIMKGDRVGLHLPTCPQYVIAYYAILSLGAIVVNLNPIYTEDEITGVIKNVEMKALITSDVSLATIRLLCKKVSIPIVIVTKLNDFIAGAGKSTADSLGLEKGWHHYSSVLEECTDTKRPRVEINPDDPALLQFTGGTTGIPKGAILTHYNVVSAVLRCAIWGMPAIQDIPPERRYIFLVLPLFHVYGNIVSMNWAIFTCTTQILVPRFELEEIMKILANFKEVTYFPAVPTMLTAIINHPKVGEIGLDKKLAFLGSGAAPMPVELIEKIKNMGIYFSEGWGMTETCSVGISSPTLGRKKIGSIGIPYPDTEVKLVDVDDGVTEVKQGSPGEMIIKGPMVMKGYWNNPEETANQLKDGWLYTGDIAIQDEDGYFFIVDRKKDMIIAGGFNIYPREIDEVLHTHPKIAQAITVGVHDDYRGETVKAFIVLKKGEAMTEKEVISFCKEKLVAYKVPKMVEFRDSLPQSAVGKVLRKTLREEEEAKKKK